VEHFYVKFGPIAAAVLRFSAEKQTVTHRQTNGAENHTPATTVGVGNYISTRQ